MSPLNSSIPYICWAHIKLAFQCLHSPSTDYYCCCCCYYKYYINFINYRVIEVMSEHGANCTLADVEGNTAKDLAVKNGQTKAARYLSVLMKQRASKGKNGSMVVSIQHKNVYSYHLCSRKWFLSKNALQLQHAIGGYP